MTTPATDLPNYQFVPTVRMGLAACISGAATTARVQIEAQVRPTADGTPPIVAGVPQTPPALTIELLGPGDVLGFDPAVVIRTDPRPSVGNYEPNFMPLVEMPPDFPWRFTPKAANDPTLGGVLSPWINLIVLVSEPSGGYTREFESLEQIQSSGDKRPIMCIKGVDTAKLPDLNQAWKWAHVQVTGPALADTTIDADRSAAMQQWIKGGDGVPLDVSAVARLLCPRRLAPHVRYSAFIVPTFKIGVLAAGLGTSETTDTALTFAWMVPNPRHADGSDPKIDLPYYYKFDFATGAQGDFEQLVRQLQPLEGAALNKLGVRRMDCADLEYGLPPVERLDAEPGDENVLGLEGALKPACGQPTSWGNDRNDEVTELHRRLADLLNMSAQNEDRTDATPESAATRPVITPPIYARWHSGTRTVSAEGLSSWVNQLNLDPRHRAAAGFGALVIDKEQESLMASIWDQLGDIELANDLLRRGQLGLEASKSLFSRFATLQRDAFLWVAAPVFGRTQIRNGETGVATSVAKQFQDSRIPAAALDPAFRRILRPRGGLRKRQRARPASQSLLARLNDGTIAAAGAAPDVAGMPSMCSVTHAALEVLTKKSPTQEAQDSKDVTLKKGETQASSHSSGFNDFCEEAITCERLYAATEKSKGRQQLHRRMAAEAICSALGEWLQVADKPESKMPIDLDEVARVIRDAIDPRTTIPARVMKRITLRPETRVRQRRPLDTLEAEIEFPQPMYEPLRNISQDLILPGIETVPQNKIAILTTNRRFVESYMSSLSSCLVGEAKWRRAPIYLQNTFFRQFWDVRGSVDTQQDSEQSKDITRLARWKPDSALGSHSPRPEGAGGEAVVLIRGDLFKRYPNTLVYGVRAQANGLPELEEYMSDGATVERHFPVFTGSLQPDLNFFGFDVTIGEMRDGYFIVLEERLSEARFGFDIPAEPCPQPVSSAFDLTWAHFQSPGCTPETAAVSALPENGFFDDRTLSGSLATAWSQSSASVAKLCLQRPVRIAMLASQLLGGDCSVT